MCGGLGRPSIKVISGRKSTRTSWLMMSRIKGLHAVLVLGAHHKIERDGRRVIHEIAHLEIGAGHVLGDQGIAVERQKAHRGGEHRAALLVGAVHHVAGGGSNGGVGGPALSPAVGDHFVIEVFDAAVGIGER